MTRPVPARPRLRPSLPVARPLAVLLLALAPLAPAQAGAPAAPPIGALDAQASVAPLRHAGSLASYRRLDSGPALDWTEANAVVGRVGGWRAYAREAARPDPAASAPMPPTPATSGKRP